EGRLLSPGLSGAIRLMRPSEDAPALLDRTESDHLPAVRITAGLPHLFVLRALRLGAFSAGHCRAHRRPRWPARALAEPEERTGDVSRSHSRQIPALEFVRGVGVQRGD